MGYYDTALICLNGHVVNERMKESPEHNTAYCKKCGSKNIFKCIYCQTDIKGYYKVDGVVVLSTRVMKAPSYCHNCGKPYPWTESSIQAFKDLTVQIEQLSKEEQDELSNSIEDIVVDTPRTQVASFIIKRAAKKISTEIWEIMKQIIINIGTEAARKQIGI